MNTQDIIHADQIERDAWCEMILTAYKAHRYEEVLTLMAANLRDKADVYSLIENHCAESSPMKGAK